MQENHYYPFGLKMEGKWAPQIGKENRYQYNGKELNKEFGLNWNDYGARFYDPAIARWSTKDPLAEKYYSWSPYNYVLNNPTNAIDPDGREVIVKNKEDQEYFLGSIKDVLGEKAGGLFSFSKGGKLKVDKKGLKKLEDGTTKDIVSGFRSLAKSKSHSIEFKTHNGEDGSFEWNPKVTRSVTNKDADGIPVKTSETAPAYAKGKGIVLTLKGEVEGIFAELKSENLPTVSDKKAIILMDPNNDNGVFTSENGTTVPCPGCILIHEFLDHAKAWMDNKGEHGVESHNKALNIKSPGSPLRDGKDHEEKNN